MKINVILKDVRLLRHWCHPALIWVVDDCLKWWPTEFVITSLWRKRAPGESGIHATNPLRAMDVRSRIFPASVSRQIEDKINKEWIYDPKRPNLKVCVWHDTGQGEHFHLQVHDRTCRRKDDKAHLERMDSSK